MRSMVEPFKTLLIILLILVMLTLFLQSWFYDGTGMPSLAAALFGRDTDAAPDVVPSRAETYGAAVVPIRAALISPDGVFGAWLSDHEVSSLHTRLSPLIVEALGSADEAKLSSRFAWEQRLRNAQHGFYFEFSDAQPMRLFALSQGVEYGDDNSPWIDRVAVCGTGDRFEVLFGGDDVYYIASTVPLSSALAGFAPFYSPNGFGFGYGGEREQLHGGVAPSVQNLAAAAPSSTETVFSSLLEAFMMNPMTNYRYTSAAGTQYAVEDTRNLTMTLTGELVFTNSATAIAPTIEPLSLTAAIERCRAMAERAVSLMGGDAVPSLRSAETTDDGCKISFGYTAGGAPIYIGGGTAAMVFELRGGTLVSAQMTLRRYTFDTTHALLMPPLNAAAIGATRIAYFDDGTTVTACWSE